MANHLLYSLSLVIKINSKLFIVFVKRGEKRLNRPFHAENSACQTECPLITCPLFSHSSNQYPKSKILRSESNIQGPVFRVQCPDSSAQSPASSVEHPESSVQNLASRVSRIQHPKYSVQSLVSRVSRIRRPESNVQILQNPASSVHPSEFSVQLLCQESRNSGMPIIYQERFNKKRLEIMACPGFRSL